MGLMRRAFLYDMRNKGKSLILLFVLLAATMLAITGVAMSTSIEAASLDLRQSIGASIKLERDDENSANWTYQQGVGGFYVSYIGTPITDNEINKIMALEGIKSYNGVGDGAVFAEDFSFIPGISFGAERESSRIPSVTDSELFSYFKRGAFNLLEGRHIVPSDDHAVLISSDLASYNNLKIGDTITVQCCFDVGGYPDVELEIVGIYESKVDDGPIATTSTDKRNRLITDHNALQEIMQHERIQYDNGVEFFVEDPKDAESTMTAIRGLDLDWNSFKLTADTAAYDAFAPLLETMQGLASALVVAAIVVGVGATMLLLLIWMRQRIHETGILLSCGVGKAQIVGQRILEVLAIAAIAFVLSFPLSAIATSQINGLLLNSMANTEIAADTDMPDDGSEYLDIAGEYLPYNSVAITTSNLDEVHISPSAFATVYLLGSGLCLLVVIATSAFALKSKPRDMLSQS